VGDLSAVPLVLHHQHFHLPDVVDDDLPEAIGQDVPVRVLGAKSNARHDRLALEAPPHGVINTPWLSPALRNPGITITVEPLELVSLLLHNFWSGDWLRCHG